MLSAAELQRGFLMLGIEIPGGAKTLIELTDVDGDGTIDYREFLEYVEKQSKPAVGSIKRRNFVGYLLF